MEQCEMNGFVLQRDVSYIKIRVKGDEETLIEFKLTKEEIIRLHDSGISFINIPYADIYLYNILSQIEETNADYAEFQWNLEEGEYKLRAYLSNDNPFFNWFYNLGGERSIRIN